jgi:hypothetical protein
VQFDTRNNVIKNNVLYANSQNIFIMNEYAQNIGNVVDYNVYYSAAGAGSGRWRWKNVLYTTFPVWQNTGNDAHSKFLDPKFMDITTPDLHVQSGSTVLDCGDASVVASGELDIDGENRIQGLSVDIGADERSGTAVNVPAKLAVPGGSVIASADDGNVAANTVDGSLSTRWSASGDGQWIRYDLGAVKTVSFLKFAMYSGASRQAIFDIRLSSDGTTWTTVFSGRSSGTTLNLETYDIPDQSARYIMYLGHGNSSNAWNSITESEVWGF